MAKEMFEGFFPEEVQEDLAKYFAKFGFECHLREWNVTKLPGMEEFDITVKVHANRRMSGNPLTQ